MCLDPVTLDDKISSRNASLNKKPKDSHNMLERAMKLDWESVTEWLKEDKEFDNLRKKKRCWKNVNKTIKSYEATINVALRDELLKMQDEDQKYRSQMRDVEEKYGWQSPEMGELWKKQSKADSINIANQNSRDFVTTVNHHVIDQ